MSDDEGASTGVYMPQDSTLLDRYDQRYPDHKRSEAIRNAMELQLVVEDLLDDHDYGFSAEREKRHWVRQALLDKIRAERDR